MLWLRVILVSLLLHFATSQVLVQIDEGGRGAGELRRLFTLVSNDENDDQVSHDYDDHPHYDYNEKPNSNGAAVTFADAADLFAHAKASVSAPDDSDEDSSESASDYAHNDAVAFHPRFMVAAQKLEERSLKIAQESNQSWMDSVDWISVGMIIMVVVGIVMLLIIALWIFLYVDFPFAKLQDIIKKHCCRCCPADTVNAIQLDDDEEDCKIQIDVYSHRNSILTQY